MMKALVKTKPRTGLWIENIPMPSLTDDEVLIKIKKTALCSTDLRIYHWDSWAQHNIVLPLVVGHEFMGEIVELGKNVKQLKVGDRVSGEGHINCGYCRNCRNNQQYLCPSTQFVGIQRQGVFAEYLSFPAKNVIQVAESVSDEIAAILDPLGHAIHSVIQFPIAGESLLITGAGSIGLMTVSVTKMLGAKHIVITDINDYRLRLAKKMGATRAINVRHAPLNATIKELNLKDGFKVGFEMSGSANGLPLLLQTISHGGQINLLGAPGYEIPLDCQQIIFKGVTLQGIYGRKMFATWIKMLDLLETGLNVDPIITHHFSVNEYKTAFETAISGQAGKVLLDWTV